MLTVALGIGAGVTVFTVVNAVLLRPLPVPAAERLILLGHVAPGQPRFSECLLASGVPTRRATRVDPMAALRVE